MKLFLYSALLITLFTTFLSAQPGLSSDRDYSNFKRNYDRAVKAFADKDSCNASCKRRMANSVKYAKRFLTKLNKKYGAAKFQTEANKLNEIQQFIEGENSAKESAKGDEAYILLWQYKLNFANGSGKVLKDSLKDFDENKLRTTANRVITSNSLEDSKSRAKEVLAILDNYESHLVKKNVFDETKGVIGSFIARAKDIQDKEYLIQTLTMAKDSAEALLIISPKSPSLNAKLKEINQKLGNPEGTIANTKAKFKQKSRKKTDNVPVVAHRNASLERKMMNLYKARGEKGLKINRLIINSRDWGFEKDRIGRIIRRQRITAFLIEKGGECFVDYVTFEQFGNGARYGRLKIQGMEGRYLIDCEKIK